MANRIGKKTAVFPLSMYYEYHKQTGELDYDSQTKIRNNIKCLTLSECYSKYQVIFYDKGADGEK